MEKCINCNKKERKIGFYCSEKCRKEYLQNQKGGKN